MSSKPSRIMAFAERAATHPRIEDAVRAAIRSTLPGVIRELLGEMAEEEGGTVRLYSERQPQETRRARDERIRALLSAGLTPEAVSIEVGCSRRHAYTVRNRMRVMCKTSP